jgi:hypothetical protein
LSRNTDLRSWDLGDGADMEEAMKVFMKKHCGKIMPPEFLKSFGFSKEDDTVGMTM